MADKAQDDDLVMSLVEMALARPPEEREAYLEGACTGDANLFGEARKYVQWEERMNGFLLDPLCPPPREPHFSPGEVLDNRFRIVREVGEGGMGIVYEAFDRKVERRIAVKCAKTGFRKRLPPEVRNAREISHPNVCKIFEIHTTSTPEGDLDFITMEFLDGQTLAERIRGGPLPDKEARAIARQLCDGLAEAHRNQVIHGDLKSNNVILTTGTDGAVRAVITDFGLARRPETSQQSAQSGEQGGTPDYMAPELWKGERATLASDVYALGVILYELASGGKRPHDQPTGSDSTTKTVVAAASTKERWQARLQRRPPPVNPAWDRILQRALDPDPGRRFADGSAVAKAMQPPATTRRLLTVAAAVLLTAVSGVVTYRQATAPAETVRLAVLPFEATADTMPIAGPLFREATANVARLKGNDRRALRVVPQSRVEQHKVESDDRARELLDATHVLHTALRQEGDGFVLDAWLTDARSGVRAKDWTAVYRKGETGYIPGALAGFVTWTMSTPPIDFKPAVNAAASAHYARGRSLLRRDSTVDRAVEAFDLAVAADPDSALTHAGLAEALWFKFFLTNDDAWLARSKQAEGYAERRNPDAAPVHRIAGLHLAGTGQYELAEARYRRAVELEPGDPENHRRLALAYERSNRDREALMEFHAGLAADARDFRLLQEIGAFSYRKSAYGEAIKHLRAVTELAPDEPNAHRGLAAAYLNAGHFKEAEQEFRRSIALRESPAALNSLGQTLIYQSREREAIPYFERALAIDSRRYFSWMYLGVAYRRLNRPAEARDANQRGLALAEGEMGRNSRLAYVRSLVAYLCAQLGNRQRALSEVAQAIGSLPTDADVRWMAVLTYEALGEREASLRVLSHAPSGLLEDLNRWPDVAGLAKDPRFQKLRKE